MQHSLRVLLKRSIILSTLTAIGCIVLFATLGLVQSATTQATKRSFESKIPPHVPLKIKIKKEKEDKALDLNNKNWLKDIEIEVTNTSDKPIYFLSLFVEMPDLPQDRPGVNRVFLLGYGRGDFIEQNTRPMPEDIPIEPKATYTFVFGEIQRRGYEAFRARNNREDPVKLQVSINHLSYGDGTGFTSLGALPFPFTNNPEELGRCSPKPRPPDEWSKRPAVFSALLAQNLVEPARFLPVNFFSKNKAAPDENLKSTPPPDICCPGTPCNKFKNTQYSNGFNLTDSAHGVDFNLNNKGGSEKVAWSSPNSDDAWLAVDRNGNGTIDAARNCSVTVFQAVKRPASWGRMICGSPLRPQS